MGKDFEDNNYDKFQHSISLALLHILKKAGRGGGEEGVSRTTSVI